MKAFFDAIRPAFGGKLTTDQVAGMQALIEEGAAADLPLHHMANVLAQVRRETGGRMYPIKETVMPYHKDANPSDGTVIARLDREWAKPGHGGLRGVKAPYWRKGMFGRGQLQISLEDNYRKMSPYVGVDLVKNPSAALDLHISAKIAIEGMRHGLFRGLKLSDFQFPADLSNPVKTNPRRIVNGNDGSDMQVAGFHRDFAKALDAAGWGVGPAKDYAPPSPAETPSSPVALSPSSGKGLAAFLEWLASLLRRP